MKRLFITLLFILSYRSILGETEDVYIDTAYYRRISQFDNGSLHLFIANKTQDTVNVSDVFVNNISLDRLNDEACLWYQVVSSDIAPEHVGEVIIKFFRLPDKDKPLDVKIITKSGRILEREVMPDPNPLLITYIGFSSDLMNLYIYLENNASLELAVKDIYLHTRKMTGFSYIPEDKIQPGKRVPVIVHLLEPLTQGEFVTVKVTTDKDTVRQNTVRAFSRFPVTFEDGSSAPGTYLDPEAFILTNPAQVSQSLGFNSRPVQRIIEWLGCPMHAHGALQSAARKIANLYQEKRKRYPYYPGCISICRYEKEWSYFIFGQVADCVKINPNQVSTAFRDTTHKVPDSAGLKHMQVSKWLTELARKGSYPRAVYTSPVVTKNSPYYTYRYPTPEELRLMTYYEICGGAKGIMFRSYGWNNILTTDKKLADEFQSINAELQVLKRFLQISEPVNLTESKDPKISANTILAGDRGIVLILLNEDIEIDYNSIEKPFVCHPRDKFNVEIKIPDWMKIEDVYQVGGTYSRLDYSYKENVITIPISRLDITAQIVLTTDPNDYIYDQDHDGMSDIDEIVSYGTDIFRPDRK